MYKTCFVTVLIIECVASFWFKDLVEPKKLFCKICPLYCRPKVTENKKEESEPKSERKPILYVDEDGPFFFADHFDNEYEWSFHKWATPATTTTTTPAPPAEEPTGICILCKLKCDYPKS